MKYKMLLLAISFSGIFANAIAQNTWLTKASVGTAGRMGAVAFSVGGKGYMGTGGDFLSVYYKDFWEYDPILNTWTQKADFPGTARYRSLGMATSTKGYLGTGYNGTDSKDLYEYDPVLNTWTAKANMGTIGRFGAVSFVIGSKIYAGTGVKTGAYAKDFWEYNTGNDTWTQKADFGGEAKIYATGFSIGANGYLGTGVEFTNIGFGTTDFWLYDTTANTWIQKADFPGTKRSEAVGLSIGGYGLMGTGTSNWGSGALKDFWKYDPTTDTWTALANYPGGAVEEATGFVINCKAYVGTGFNNDNTGTLKKTFYEYTPDFSCGGALPQSVLQASDTVFCGQECLSFFDNSLNAPTGWQWFFPGATPDNSSMQNPTDICYSAPGEYDVTLITSNAFGNDTLLLINYITVYAAPTQPSITQSNDTLICTSANFYQWFLDGIIIPGATDQEYIMIQTGTYIVEVSDSNGCSASDTLIVTQLTFPNFSAAEQSLCQKFCTDFFDQSTNDPTSWQWIFEGGSPSTSSLQNPTNICYNSTGVYDVTLITTGANGKDTLLLSNYITVNATPPIPTITQIGYVLTSSVAATYQWQLNSNDLAGATDQSYTVLQTGTYTVIISDSNGCKNSASTYVLITGVDELNGNFNFSITPNPSNGSFTIEMNFGKGNDLLEIEIVNALGQIIYSSNDFIFFPNEIQLHDVADGIYFITLRSDKISLQKKLVIAKN